MKNLEFLCQLATKKMRNRATAQFLILYSKLLIRLRRLIEARQVRLGRVVRQRQAGMLLLEVA